MAVLGESHLGPQSTKHTDPTRQDATPGVIRIPQPCLSPEDRDTQGQEDKATPT